ncbi:biotin/lipoyl-binding protein [soil metagenome]
MLTRYFLPFIALCTLTFAVMQMTKANQKPPVAVPPVEPARSPFAKQLAGAGLVEPETENLAIGTNLPGIVEQVYVKVGDTVKPGMPLFRLDERSLRAELAIREANVANSNAMLDKLEQSPRKEELPPLEAKVAEATANLNDQLKVLERLKRVSAGAASEDEVSRREFGVEMAKAQLKKVEADLSLLNAGAWKYDRLVANAAVLQAKASLQQTKTELERLTVKAPRMHWDDLNQHAITEFKVLQVNVRPGEYVATSAGQPLVFLGYVGKLHVRIDIDENDISRFRPNLPGYAQPRGNDTQRYAIKFVRVEPYVIPKRQLTGASTERVDTRVLQVIYAIEVNGSPLYVGQQMDVFLNAE